MSLGATMSAPASASDAAVLASRATLESFSTAKVIAVASDDAAVAVRGVLAQANVGDHDQGFSCGATVLIARRPRWTMPSAAQAPLPCSSFLVRNAEQQHAADAERGAGFDFLHRFVDGEIEDARHGADLAAHAFAFAEKQRVDEGRGLQMGFAHERAHGGGGAQTAQTGCRKFHADNSMAKARIGP